MSNNVIIYTHLKYRGCKKLKECKFCNAQLPDEASFCLSCSSSLNFNDEPDSKNPKVFLHKKAVAFSITLLFIFTLSAISAYRIKRFPLKPQTNTPETVLVPVTEENGETVTDSQGDTVYEPVTVETTTKKPTIIGVISSLINGDKDKGKTEETSSPSTGTSAPRPADTTASEEKPNVTNPTETDPIKESSTDEDITKEENTSSISDFTYTEFDGKIKITKYTGTASTVTVPAYIDGKQVAYLGEKAFANNNNIKTIVFSGAESGSRFYLPYDTIVFYNLPNLISVTFPYETNNYMLSSSGEKSYQFSFYKLFTECESLQSVNFSENVNPKFKNSYHMTSVDGVVFTQTDSNIRQELIYYPLGKTSSNFTVPENTYSINEYAFLNNPYIETVTFTKNFGYISCPNFVGCTNLKSYNVTAGNINFFSENGVLYTKGLLVNDIRYAGVFYPPGKIDTTFTFTDKVNIAFDQYTFCGNPYIQTAKCPSALWIQTSVATSELHPTSLKTIYVNKAKGSENRLWADKYYNFEYF